MRVSASGVLGAQPPKENPFPLHKSDRIAIDIAGPGDPIALIAILALLVIGEEIGWRGFALPRLQARFGGLGASLILGVLWAAWHLANTAIPGLERYWYGFGAFALFVVAQTVLFTWIANHTRGSVLLAWLFHAAINIAGSQFAIGDPVRQWWLSGAVFGVIALAVIAFQRSDLGSRVEKRQLQREPAARV